MQKKFVYQQLTIHYRVEGKGQPMVLIHGFGEDGHIWDEQVAFLKEHCQLFIPDLPGSGLSPVNDVSDTLQQQLSTIPFYAECIHALLKEENIQRCTMIGHSMGGYITLAFTEKYPQAVAGFGFVHSTAFADSEEKKATRQRGIELMGQYDGYSFLKNTIPNQFGEAFKKEHPGKIDTLIEAARQFDTPALQNYYRAMMARTDKTSVLRGSKVPVLFIMGTEDLAAPIKDVLQQVYLPQYSYIHVLERAGHMGMWEAPGKVNQYLLEYINR